MTCRRGHEFRGDENYRARHGHCPYCLWEAQARYRQTEKRRACDERYEQSEKAQARKDRYRQSPKGWLNDLRLRRSKAVKRRADRETE